MKIIVIKTSLIWYDGCEKGRWDQCLYHIRCVHNPADIIRKLEEESCGL